MFCHEFIFSFLFVKTIINEDIGIYDILDIIEEVRHVRL